jgi:hypothetical protein
VIGGAYAIVTRCEIEPVMPGPDTLIAWRTDEEQRVGRLIAAARDLYGA